MKTLPKKTNNPKNKIKININNDKIFTQVLYHSVFDLFPLTYMCVDTDFRIVSASKAEKIHLRNKESCT